MTDDPTPKPLPQLPVPSRKLDLPEVPPRLDELDPAVTVLMSDADRAAYSADRKRLMESNALAIRNANMKADRAIKANRLAKEAREQGFAEAVDQLIPHVITNVLHVQAMVPEILHLVEASIKNGDTDALKSVNPVLKTLLVEQEKLMGRMKMIGPPVSKQEIKQETTSTHTEIKVNMDLADLVRARKEQIDQSGDKPIIDM